MSTPFKTLKSECVQAYAATIQETHGVIPEEFAERWAEEKWDSIQSLARHAITGVLAHALRDFARTKCTEAICEQLNLPGLFEDLPIAVPTANDGYCGAGLATEEDWERAIAVHLKQITGHEESVARIRKHIAERRAKGIAPDMGWYEQAR